MRLVECSQCGAKNRIRSLSFNRTPICGRCHASLSEPTPIRFLRVALNHKYWILLAVIIGGGFFFDRLYSSQTIPGVTKTQSRALLASAGTRSEYSSISVNQGVHKRFTQAEMIAPLRIVTPVGPERYYVKLIDAFAGTTIVTFFIFGGQTFDTKVPLGTYLIKYAAGENWYGENYLFGSDTRYSEADKIFEFAEQGSQIGGYTVELIRQLGGNLRTKSIAANQF